MKNVPYVKQFDKEGLITNPITKHTPYLHEYKNSREQKLDTHPKRFQGNGKNYPLVVLGTFKFLKCLQVVYLKDKKGYFTGKVKYIQHHLPV